MDQFQIVIDEVNLPSEYSRGAKAIILRAACKVALESGLGRNTLSGVAKAAELSVQRLRYHYPQLDLIYVDLLKCIFISGREATVQTLLSQPPQVPKDVIVRMVQGLFLWVRLYTHLSRLSSVMSVLASGSKMLGPIYEQEFQIGYQRLAQAVHNSFPQLEDEALHQMSRALHLVMVGMLEDLHRKGDVLKHVDAQEKEALSIIARLMRQIGA